MRIVSRITLHSDQPFPLEALVLFSRAGEKKFNLRRSCNIELTNGIGGCVTFIACVDVGVFAFLGFALLA